MFDQPAGWQKMLVHQSVDCEFSRQDNITATVSNNSVRLCQSEVNNPNKNSKDKFDAH